MSSVFFHDRGQGRPIVLLHGFLESHLIWKRFSEDFLTEYRVIAVDLPGFGNSQLPIRKPFSIAEVATLVLASLEPLQLSRPVLVGHSLGGYVTLAMIEQQPKVFSAFCLFHSTAYADSSEKKEARTKTIDFVERNGSHAFTSNFVPPLFANPNHQSIAFATSLAVQTPQDTVTGYLQAMRDRPDRTEVIRQFEGPIAFIAGDKDEVISAEALEKQSRLAKKAHFSLMKGVAHMGMFEAPAACAQALLTLMS
jgi:pimeloyl-ACP methyl ester carboxylesterase